LYQWSGCHYENIIKPFSGKRHPPHLKGVLLFKLLFMIKLTKRKGFNFFRSYFDVYNELETNEDKVAFIEALLDRQFMGIKPTNLKGMAKFAYISQTNSIDSQVKGYEDKTGNILHPTVGGGIGVIIPPAVEVKEKVQVEVKENSIDSRKLKFAHTLKPFVDLYGKETIRNFYEYWTEPNKTNKKFRQELQKTWSVERRLRTWNENNFNNKNNGKSKITDTNEFKQIVTTIKSDGVRR
jgi:hypothetical protein